MTPDELRKAREDAGFNMEELARIAGKQYNTIWRYEYGKLPVPQLLEIVVLLIQNKKNRRFVEKYLNFPLP